MSFSVTLQYQETISYTFTNNISETKKKKSQTLLGLKVRVDFIYGKVKKRGGKPPKSYLTFICFTIDDYFIISYRQFWIPTTFEDNLKDTLCFNWASIID